MATCRCAPPPVLHITPRGVHAPAGRSTSLVVVDEAWADVDPSCSTCGAAITGTCFRCEACGVLICRDCVALDTAVVECDCVLEVTGVQLAARRAAAAVGR